jgi:hypothetical protein
MKKFLLIVIAIMLIPAPAQAGFWADHKAKAAQTHRIKADYNEIKAVLDKQLVYSNKYDLEGLAALYSDDFINCDGFNKEVYFKLVKDTWETYKNIAYSARIENIYYDGDYAQVQVFETAAATTSEVEESISAYGELVSAADCIYYLEKSGQKWIITSENVINEKSLLRYGDARYMDVDMVASAIVSAGKPYTAALKFDVPENSVAVASISSSKVEYPQVKSEDAFRQMPEDSNLERVLTANKDNVNEYAVGAVGIAKFDGEKVYLAGLAFILSRVNVIPENKFIKVEEENGKDK